MKLISALLVALTVAACQAVILDVPGYATLNGTTDTTYHFKRPFFKFRGLYYGQKPTSETRFLPPVPYTPEPDVIYDAVTTRPGCPQNSGGNEDCLIVNVFTPKLPSGENPELLPVIFWIHGGSFATGGNLLYGGDKYLDQDVVMVAVQYRLSALGFLSLNTDEIPGNAGIFDQIEALRWVNKYIKYFGGDPNLVTIVGESAGGASVSLLMMAPQARGLFHRVISESGTMLVAWALDREPVKHGRRIAEIAGCPLEPYADLLNCLRTIDAQELTDAFNLFVAEDRKAGGLGFGGSSPVIQVAGAERLLTEDPRKLMETGNYATDVPILYGANKQEGTLVLAYLYNDFLVPNNLVNDSQFLANDLVPVIIKALGVEDPDGQIAKEYTEKYLGSAQLGDFQSMVAGLTDMTGVLFEKEGAYQTVQLHSKFNPNSYWYAFNYEGRFSLFNVLFAGHIPPIPHGVCHADEMLYLFAFPTFGNNFTEAILSQRMIQVWTNFAKYGVPTPDGVELMDGIPKFLPYTDSTLHYMNIDRDWSLMQDYPKTFTVTVDELPL